MPPAPSLVGRATAAVLLMVGFYGLALGTVVALIAVPLASLFISDWLSTSVQVKLFIFGAVGSWAILKGVMPRRDVFDAPGPMLTADKQPRVFETIRDVARSTQQAMPVEVYLIPNVNAWVAQRGGFMGFGSHRVMAVGLPLLQVLSIDELRAVLAHEFGHYHGGDTALGPWIYKTRAAIGRTLQSLEKHNSVLSIPFEWYGKNFLRITHGISRQQEYAADALAASVVGASALANGLRAISGAGAAFPAYWFSHVVPVFSQGYRPPIAAGFAEFLADPQTAAGVERSIDAEMAHAVARESDTHPPLRDRITALGAQAAASPRDDGPRAISLLESVDKIEGRLEQFLRVDRDASANPFTPISWDDVGPTVWPAIWRGRLESIGEQLNGLTPAHYPQIATDVPAAAARCGFVSDGKVPHEEVISYFVQILWTALANALVERGWNVVVRPRGEMVFSKNGTSFAPYEELRRLIVGEQAADAWAARWQAIGLLDVNVGVARAVAAADAVRPAITAAEPRPVASM